MTLSSSLLAPINWEEKYIKWAEGPSVTEQQRCENVQRMVNEAIKAHPKLKNRKIKVFLQGSYHNRTNIRQESDVDVCVLCKDAFFPDYSLTPNINNTVLGSTASGFTLTELKQEIKEALVTKFGRNHVRNGDKAFNIRANTYRVDADVVPTFEGRLYHYNNYNKLTYYSGTALKSNKDGRLIYNWPEQHYNEGIYRHEVTARQFKKKVRILKNLCNEMRNQGIASAGKVSSFLLESLVFNCPDEVFTAATHYEDLRRVIYYLYYVTANDTTANNMMEVNNIKPLFRSTQAWNRNDANHFLESAWNYVGF
jgi:hypothetical protein